MTTEHRLERLERQNLWLKLYLLPVATLILVGALVGANAVDEHKPIDKLEIVDAHGKVRIRLGTEPQTGNGTIDFFDKDGALRRVSLNQYAIDFFNETDKNAIAEFAPGQLYLRDENGKMRVLLSFGVSGGKTQSAGLRLSGPGGYCKVLSQDDTGPQILFAAPDVSAGESNAARVGRNEGSGGSEVIFLLRVLRLARVCGGIEGICRLPGFQFLRRAGGRNGWF